MTVLSTAVVSSLAVTNLSPAAAVSIVGPSESAGDHPDATLIAMWEAAEVAISEERRARKKRDRLNRKFENSSFAEALRWRPECGIEARLRYFLTSTPDRGYDADHVRQLKAVPSRMMEPDVEARRQAIVTAEDERIAYFERPTVKAAEEAAVNADLKALDMLQGLAEAPAMTIAGLKIKAAAIKWLRNGSFDVEAGCENWDEPVIASLLRDLLPAE